MDKSCSFSPLFVLLSAETRVNTSWRKKCWRNAVSHRQVRYACINEEFVIVGRKRSWCANFGIANEPLRRLVLRSSRSSTETRVSSLVITAWTLVIMWFWREGRPMKFPQRMRAAKWNENRYSLWWPARRFLLSFVASSFAVVLLLLRERMRWNEVHASFSGQKDSWTEETVSIERGKKDFEFSFNRILYTPRNFVRRDFDAIPYFRFFDWFVNNEYGIHIFTILNGIN